MKSNFRSPSPSLTTFARPLPNGERSKTRAVTFRSSIRLEKRQVSRIRAIEGLLARAAHHDIEHEFVAVLVGIRAERADLVGLLHLARIFHGKAQEGRLAICSLD